MIARLLLLPLPLVAAQYWLAAAQPPGSRSRALAIGLAVVIALIVIMAHLLDSHERKAFRSFALPAFVASYAVIYLGGAALLGMLAAVPFVLQLVLLYIFSLVVGGIAMGLGLLVFVFSASLWRP